MLTMAAVAARLHCDFNRDNGPLERETLPLKIGLDNHRWNLISIEWMRRCASSCRGRDLALGKTTPVEISLPCVHPFQVTRSILEILSSSGPGSAYPSQIEPPPPSYNDSVADLPPSYDLEKDLASNQLASKRLDVPPTYDYTQQSIISPPEPMTAPDIDLGDTSNFRQAAGKKAKKAAKQASQARWADNGDGGSKDGGDGEDNGEGGGGVVVAAVVMEEMAEEQMVAEAAMTGMIGIQVRTRRRERRPKTMRRRSRKRKRPRKKEEEEAAKNKNPLSWADEGNDDAGDDWGAFTATTKKDKKGKKGKTDSIPEKAATTSYFDDISLDDTPKIDLDFGIKDNKGSSTSAFSGWNSTWNTGGGWGFGAGADHGSTDIADSFSKTTKDTADIADTANSWSFGGNKKNKKKTTSTGFEFGDFSTLEEKEEEKVGEVETGGDDDLGTFGSAGKKDKKKKKSAFEDSATEPDLATIGTAIIEPDHVAGDTWGSGWGTTTTKKKKGKRGEEETQAPPPPPLTAPEAAAADEWGGFGTKKNKKGGKKITEIEEPAILAAPDAGLEPEADTGWGAFGKKEKKKGKTEAEKVEGSTVTAPPEVDQEPDLGFGWGSFGRKDKKKDTKRDVPAEEPITVVDEPEAEAGLTLGFRSFNTKKEKKKIGKKDDNVEEQVDVLDPGSEAVGGWSSFGTKKQKKGFNKADEPAFTASVDPDPKPDEGWGAFSTKKDKKKPKKSPGDEPEEEGKSIAEHNFEPDDTADTGWGSFGTKTSKKATNTSIWGGGETEEQPAVENSLEPDNIAATGWGSFGSKKDKKKGKKEDFTSPPPPPDPEPVVEEKPNLMRTGSKKDKKGKKSLIAEVNEDSLPATDCKSTADATSNAADDDWMSGLGTADKKKDKKNKRNSIASSTKEEATPPPPPVPDIPEASSDIWGSTKKAVKGKKGKVTEHESAVDAIPEPDHTKEILADEDWQASLVGLSPKDKRKRIKQRETERKELEAKEKEEEEAKQKKQEEEQKEADEWEASLVGLNPKDRKKKEREREKAKKAKESEEQEEKERTEQKERERQEEEEQEKQEAEERAKEQAKEDDWAKGLTPTQKRKKEKERERERKEKERLDQEEKDRLEQEEKERLEQEERERQEEEDRAAREEEAKRGKGKLGKKGKTSTSPEVSKTKDLLAGSVPDTALAAEEDTWGSWGGGASSSKKTKKGGRNDMPWEAPPPAPTPPAQGLTPEPEEQDLADNGWGSFGPAKAKGAKVAKNSDAKAGKKGAKDKSEEAVVRETSLKDDSKEKDAFKEETSAKAARSFWDSMATASTSKSKTSTKDAAKAKKDGVVEADEVSDVDKIIETVEEPAKKSTEGKINSKLTKTTAQGGDKSKSSDAKKKGMADDFMDATAAKGKDGKSKKGPDTNDKDNEIKEESFSSSSVWGSTKKPSGKKANEVKTEIGKQDWTNQKSTGKKGAWNEPELTSTETDDQPPTPQPTSIKSPMTTMSTSKTAGKSSVLQRAKEFEQIAKASKQESTPPAADPVPISKFDKKGALGKTSSKGTASKNKELSSDYFETSKGSKDSVPGSFPGEGMDDLDMLNRPPLERQDTKKSNKSVKEKEKVSKNPETPESQRPPTPPPEPKEEKPVKKERARVSKAGGPTSWGFWGAPTREVRKESKVKDDAEVPTPPKKQQVAGLVRSKSTKPAKEVIKSESKDSESDKPEKVEKPKKAESRPPKVRGSSFGGFFGGGTPARKQSVRRSSTTSGPKAASRRASVDQDATGLPSPPPEDAPEDGSKAAKLMGVGKLDRKASTRGKQKAKIIPDPYAIDSDDMVMVNGIEDPVIDTPTPNKGPKSKLMAVEPEPASLRKDLPDRTKSKRDSKMDPSSSKRKSKAGNDLDDDVVMVDAGLSSGADVADGPDDMQFITKPKGLQRSATNAKKPEIKKGGGLFGGFLKTRRAPDTERPKKAIVEEEVSPRKRTVTGGDDSAKRPRRDDRRRSERTDRASQGFVYDTAPDAGATEAEEAGARREERRAKKADRERAAREEALKYEADRRAKRRDAEKAKIKDDKDRRARKEEEAEAKREEEKDARRAAREVRRAKEEEEANRALEEDILKPRSSKRRDTEKDRDIPAESSSRPRKSDRRRSTYDKLALDEDDSRRVRHEERRLKAERRKSAAPAAVDDYFDPRNASQGGKEVNDPYGGGNEHTASWVKSQASDPPEPPLVEPSIVEPAPDLRATGADDLKAEDDIRRSSHRKSKRSSRMYTDPLAEDQDRRRSSHRREKESDGSAEGERYRSADRGTRRQSEVLGGVKLGSGTKTFDGKTGQGKRSSWFNRLGR
ncbi:hypothetical protein N7G274_003748 [Stereocaulon virgatum]|uniref:Uncharacterized protein n=1 Tax=Stereocaulon virgatum TaxID=373712 RepID=A0ABR4AF08_9LECA